jgi:hypothetical protein
MADKILQKYYNDPLLFCNGRNKLYKQICEKYKGITKRYV